MPRITWLAMLRAGGGQNPKSMGFAVIFLLYKVLSLVGGESLSFQTPQSACPILKQKGDVLQGPSTLVLWGWSQPGTQPGPAGVCVGHAACSDQAPESNASPHKSSCCREGRLFQRAWSSAEDGQPASWPGRQEFTLGSQTFYPESSLQ